VHRTFSLGLVSVLLLSGCGTDRSPTALVCSRVLVQMTVFANDLGRLAATPEGPPDEDRLLAVTDVLKAELTELHGELADSSDQARLRVYTTVLSRFELAVEEASQGRRSVDFATPTTLANEISAFNARVRAICT